MLDAVKRFFQSSMSPGRKEAGEGQDGGADEGDLKLAACALLLELAYADDAFSEEERAHVAAAVHRHFGLNPDDAERLLELADEGRRKAVDLWQFTRLIDQELLARAEDAARRDHVGTRVLGRAPGRQGGGPDEEDLAPPPSQAGLSGGSEETRGRAGRARDRLRSAITGHSSMVSRTARPRACRSLRTSS